MKTGRNDPCPCGSGKKHKKCCLSNTYVQKGRDDFIREKLIRDLLKFFKKNFNERLEDAYSIFWDDFNPAEYLDEATLPLTDINFWEWVVYDFLIDEENEKTLIDLYMERSRRLSSDEHRELSMMQRSVISLYEAQEVFPDKGLLLKDLILGGEYDVREKAATKKLRQWDIFAARLLHVDGSYIMSGAVYPYSLQQKERILADIHEEFEDYRHDHPDAALDDFLKKNSDIFNYYWYDIIQNPAPVNLSTTSGEPFLFSKARFEIRDRQAVITGLKMIKGFEQDKDDFVWLDDRDREGSATVLGNIKIKKDKLILQCNSKERLERGKKLIIENIPDALIHKADTFEDPMQAVKALKERPPKEDENEIPMEIQQQMYTQFMQKHSEKWLKDNIPALNNRTPEEAVKTEEGRRKVIELLKSFENGEEHNKREGKPFHDLSWMWGRLGLKREE